MDYSNSKVVSFTTGTSKLQVGTFKLIHTINLRACKETLYEIKQMIHQNVDTIHPMYQFLSHAITTVESFINRLEPKRAKRALNFIGSAWKWISGSPDQNL